MNILVIGGQGFIGHNLVLRLVREGHNVTVFDRSIRKELQMQQCKYVEGEFTAIEKLGDIMAGIDAVYHMISTTIPKTSNENPFYDVDSNVIGSLKLIDMCRRANVKKIIFPSSGGTIYGIPKTVPIDEEHPLEPICSYAVSKLAIEKYLHMYSYLYGLDYQVLRVSNPYGPYQNPYSEQGAVGVFLRKAMIGEPIEIWGDGNVCRDYIYIDDVVEALYLSLESSAGSKVLNIGSGRGTTLNELVSIIGKVTGQEPKVTYKDARKLDSPISILNINKAINELNWKPEINIYDGIEKTWQYFKKVL